MITKNNNFLVKSLTKNLVNNQSPDPNKNLNPKKNGSIYIKLNSKQQEQNEILHQQHYEQERIMQIQQQRIQHQQHVLQKEQEKLIQHQHERQRILQQQQEQQRILQQQQEQQRILHQRQEQQRILQQQQEHQRNLQQQQEHQRNLQQQQEHQRNLQKQQEHQQNLQKQQEQQRILQQQQEHQQNLQHQKEQQRILQQQQHEQQRLIQQQEQQRLIQQQEQQRILQQQEQQRILQQQEQHRILQQQQEQQRILQQQQEQQRILQQQQQEQQRIIQQQLQQQKAKKEEINITQHSLNLPLFGKSKKTNERGYINTTQPPVNNNNNISTFSAALSDYKTKKNAKKGTLKMDIMNDDNGNDFKKIFQNMCLSQINIFPNHLLQNVVSNGENEAILIEFRILPHVEFIIKNAIVKLGDSFTHTIVCGNVNYLMMKQICDNISPNIKIIKLEKNNITINDYNNLFYDLSFWDMFRGNKLLFYQEDTIIFKNNMNEFLQYDYVGAPWDLEPNPNFPSVGNGGFSLRNRSMLMDILRNKVDIPDVNFINKKHKSGYVLENIPEDIFFSLSMLKLHVGNVPDPHVASYFSTENIVNKDSLGGHQFWLNDSSWVDRMNSLFQEYHQ